MELKPNGTMATLTEGETAMDGITATVTVTASMIGVMATVVGRATEMHRQRRWAIYGVTATVMVLTFMICAMMAKVMECATETRW